MIDRLRFIKDSTENPKLLSLIADMAQLPDKTQEVLCDAIEQGLFRDEAKEMKILLEFLKGKEFRLQCIKYYEDLYQNEKDIDLKAHYKKQATELRNRWNIK